MEEEPIKINLDPAIKNAEFELESPRKNLTNRRS